MLILFTEIVKYYGSHSTKSGLMNHFDRDLTPNVKLLRQAVANGQDAKNVILIEGVRPGKTGKGQRASLTSPYLHIARFPYIIFLTSY